MIYGNNDEYTENVKNSFLNSLKIVIDSLWEKININIKNDFLCL
jgi:hypothetical protein